MGKRVSIIKVLIIFVYIKPFKPSSIAFQELIEIQSKVQTFTML